MKAIATICIFSAALALAIPVAAQTHLTSQAGAVTNYSGNFHDSRGANGNDASDENPAKTPRPAAQLRTWNVCQDGSGDFTSIAEGLGASQAGDTVMVCPGTYNESNLQMKSGVALRSQTGDPNSVIIDAQGQGSVIICDGVDSTATIEGFTITGGLASAGGGVFLQASSLAITNCIFHDNVCNGGGGGGGAMFIHFYSSPSITGCIFTNNSAHAVGGGTPPVGGAVWCDFHCDPSFNSCSFHGNWADHSGGAIACDRWCSPVLTDCEFTENQACRHSTSSWMLSGGGAIYASADRSAAEPPEPAAPITLTDCRFIENDSNCCGGGVSCYNSAPPTVTGCVFSDNDSTDMGGGLACYRNCPATLDGCTFNGNQAAQVGGGGIWSNVFSPLSATHCTLCANSVVGVGAGIDTDGTSPVQLDNTIIAFNLIGNGLQIAGSYSTINCCDIYGNQGGDWTGSYLPAYLGVNGNIHLDPLFCEADYGDYTLRADSPCAPAYNPACGLMGAWEVGCTYAPADLNCDGSINSFDIDPFVLALTDRDGYYGVQPDCYWMNADCNQDGAVNAFDIDPFVQMLTGG